MPSWYNLFFATFGAAALLRYSERGGRGWLVVAGVMGGCSVAVKITGCYYIAACLLYFVIHAGPPGPVGDDS
jgi:4-amino-4-deoxy-L-arabinose transferase-like glycosyltransferase